MPGEAKSLCVDDLRRVEYYGMQPVHDELYRRSKDEGTLTNLVDIIMKREDVLLTYRSIKTDGESYMAGTDNRNIIDIGRMTPEEAVEKVRFIVTGNRHGYRPKPVRREDIPKPNGKTRPLDILCIWDKLIQQCAKQAMEPICEAQFSDNSYDFRPNRPAEYIITRAYSLMQVTHLHYVIEFDIRGFFDDVNHSKLIKQTWATGIRGKQLIFVIGRILMAPIRMPDGTTILPGKGTPQGGITSPLLANIVLNELDHWVESQWQNNPVAVARGRYRVIGRNGVFDKSHGYRIMKNTNLKETYIVRYADDFRILRRSKEDAEKTRKAATRWLEGRLRFEVLPEKTRMMNVRKHYLEFLGFKIRVRQKAKKYVVQSHICDKKSGIEREKLVKRVKRIARPSEGKTPLGETRTYNSMVMEIQNYFEIATCISLGCKIIHRQAMTVLANRLNSEKGCKLQRKGGTMPQAEKGRYGRSKMVRYVAGIDQPIYPPAFVKSRMPHSKRSAACSYTAEDRKPIHTNLRLDPFVLEGLRSMVSGGYSTEYTDSKISLFSVRDEKCAVNDEEFRSASEITCWLKKLRKNGGQERYQNMILLRYRYLPLLEISDTAKLTALTRTLNMTKKQVSEVNRLREQVGLVAVD